RKNNQLLAKTSVGWCLSSKGLAPVPQHVHMIRFHPPLDYRPPCDYYPINPAYIPGLRQADKRIQSSHSMDIEEALRGLAAHTEKRKRENALAAGFVGLEEYEQHKLEERQQHEIREELSIKEDCLDKGITREQYDLEREEFLLEQIERHPKPKEHHILPPIQDCDCE
ncbi:MAG: hypothetical protein Q9196_007311, partial [Gyalolechia fulgens]